MKIDYSVFKELIPEHFTMALRERWLQRHTGIVSQLAREEKGNRKTRRLKAKQFLTNLKKAGTAQNVQKVGAPAPVKKAGFKSSLIKVIDKIKSIFIGWL